LVPLKKTYVIFSVMDPDPHGSALDFGRLDPDPRGQK
jgi:hypothetical protein